MKAQSVTQPGLNIKTPADEKCNNPRHRSVYAHGWCCYVSPSNTAHIMHLMAGQNKYVHTGARARDVSSQAAHKVVLCARCEFPRFRFISLSPSERRRFFTRQKNVAVVLNITLGAFPIFYIVALLPLEALAAGARALIPATFIGFSHLFCAHGVMMAWQTA